MARIQKKTIRTRQNADKFYPETLAKFVKTSDGKTVEQAMMELQEMGFHFEIYNSLPSASKGKGNVLYLIGPTGTGYDRYKEYVFSNGSYKMIGEQSINLSGYMTTSGFDNRLRETVTDALEYSGRTATLEQNRIVFYVDEESEGELLDILVPGRVIEVAPDEEYEISLAMIVSRGERIYAICEGSILPVELAVIQPNPDDGGVAGEYPDDGITLLGLWNLEEIVDAEDNRIYIPDNLGEDLSGSVRFYGEVEPGNFEYLASATGQDENTHFHFSYDGEGYDVWIEAGYWSIETPA